MRSIEAGYKNIQIRNPNLTNYSCLAQAVKNRKFSRKSLIRAFHGLVPVVDFELKETKELIDYLEDLTNTL